jgi:hypothetical protein
MSQGHAALSDWGKGLLHIYIHTCIQTYIHEYRGTWSVKAAQLSTTWAETCNIHTYIHAYIQAHVVNQGSAALDDWGRDLQHTYIRTYVHTYRRM